MSTGSRALILLLQWLCVGFCFAQNGPEPPVIKFQTLLQKMQQYGPYGCPESPAPSDFFEQTKVIENQIFDASDQVILNALNTSHTGAAKAASQAADALASRSAEIDKSWPSINQFHYKLLDIPPILVVQYGFRNRATYSVFAVPQFATNSGNQPNRLWQLLDYSDQRVTDNPMSENLDIYPLQRGPSHRARFLTRYTNSSCGDGQTVVNYDAYEWNPSWTGTLSHVLSRKGAISGEVFPAIGKLITTGPTITLPYCWWSQLDSSVWATLCGVDTYDVAGDRVRFISTRTNRPDLAVVAQVIEYAEARDLRAVAAFTKTAAIAGRLVALMPPYVFGDTATYPPPHGDHEVVELGSDPHLRFTLVRQHGEWLVSAFSLTPGL